MELFPGLLPVRAHGHQTGTVLSMGQRERSPALDSSEYSLFREQCCDGGDDDGGGGGPLFALIQWACCEDVDALLYLITMLSGEDFLE